MKTLTYNDGMLSRSRVPKLIVGRDERIHLFAGTHIPEILVVDGESRQKNGKWSATTFTLSIHELGWWVVSTPDFDTGHRFPNCANLSELAEQFRASGCQAGNAKVIEFVATNFPKVFERLSAREQAKDSLR